MSTKLDPGQYDCYKKLADDEPYFLLRAKDPHGPAIVELWAALREAEFGPSAKFLEARACAQEMREWFTAHNGVPLSKRQALAASPQVGVQREGGQAKVGQRVALSGEVKYITDKVWILLDAEPKGMMIGVDAADVLASPPSVEAGRHDAELTDDQVLRYLSERGFAILSVGTVKELLRQSEHALEGYEANRPRQEPTKLAARASVESGEQLREALHWALGIIEDQISSTGPTGQETEYQSAKTALATPAPSEGNESARESRVSGYDLAVASKAMRGTLWLRSSDSDAVSNPTFHDWEAMARALAERSKGEPKR